MSSNKVFQYRKDVVSTHLSTGDGVLLDLSSKMYYNLNKEGMQLWDTLDGNSYDILDNAGPEVVQFVEFLLQEKLIELVSIPKEKGMVPPSFMLENSPTITRNQPLTKVTAFTAASAGGATFF